MNPAGVKLKKYTVNQENLLEVRFTDKIVRGFQAPERWEHQ
jgi:hypothetical protein